MLTGGQVGALSTWYRIKNSSFYEDEFKMPNYSTPFLGTAQPLALFPPKVSEIKDLEQVQQTLRSPLNHSVSLVFHFTFIRENIFR
jgi:hypothetical protein